MENCEGIADSTKERLLAMAEKLFAEKGYDGVSVREITQAAECNLAAINYYFGNKKNLYLDVFRQRLVPRMTKIRRQFEDILSRQGQIDLEAVIRAFITAFMKMPNADEHPDYFDSLIHREIHNPTGALEILIDDAILPFFQVMLGLFKDCMPEDADDMHLKLGVLSLQALSIHFSHARIPVSRLTGKQYDDAFINLLIDHMVSFALHGLVGKASVKENHV